MERVKAKAGYESEPVLSLLAETIMVLDETAHANAIKGVASMRSYIFWVDAVQSGASIQKSLYYKVLYKITTDPQEPDSGNIDKVRFYVCPSCGNILVSTGSASIFCFGCFGRKQEHILPTVETIAPKITVEKIETDYLVTFDHPMTKDHYLSFVAYVKSDRVFLNRLYPEQSPTCRFPITTGGKLFVYCIKHGLSVYSGNL